MPTAPLKPCAKPGCGELTHGRFCDHHRNYKDSNRLSAAKRGYGRRWQTSRKFYLIENPLCVKCMEEGEVTQATVVDHKIPHRQNERLFWDTDNWQALCKYHHDVKTASEDGGFGR